MASASTRGATEHTFLGQPAVLSANQLPTSADVYRLYNYYLQNEQYSSLHHRATAVAQDIVSIYVKASIPSIDVKSVGNRVKKLIQKVQDLAKYPTSKRTSETFQGSLKLLDTVFDICTCKCVDSGMQERSKCTCPLSCKIPEAEWGFWLDQKTVRRMYIGKEDKQETERLRKKESRASKRFKFELNSCSQKSPIDEQQISYESDNTDNELSDDDDDDVLNAEFNVIEMSSDDADSDNPSPRNTKQYPELCKALDRCKISNRHACLVVNAVLKDLNQLSGETAIDPAKLRRQRIVHRKKEAYKHADDIQKVTCIGFDGKQDETIVERLGIRRTINEEHYVMVGFPNQCYMDHVVPESKKAVDIAKEILSVITDTDSVNSLQALLCDGTVCNTGKTNGVIRQIEQGVGRPLQWLVCLLHTNELPLRRYISALDGGFTRGPSSYTGGIMSSLNFDPKDMPIAKFKPVAGKVIEVDDEFKKDLSSDQSYLLRACLAVQQGYVENEEIKILQSLMPGNVNNARWLTTANRILRYYMSQEVCSEQLEKIVRFIVNVYAPSWFNIKSHPSCADGAKNFFFLLKQCYLMGEQDWKLVEPVLQNNSYFAHWENILLSGMCDEDDDVRKFCSEKITTARSSSSSTGVRVFDKSTILLNAAASNYIDMIDWTTVVVTPPPLLTSINNDDLQQCHHHLFSGIPCHSQQVERAVKDISATTSRVYGHTARHGMILQCNTSRVQLPKLDCKSDFLV